MSYEQAALQRCFVDDRSIASTWGHHNDRVDSELARHKLPESGALADSGVD
jgi:DNA-directed RNA polymerase subunit N (RpoN/RPB10)